MFILYYHITPCLYLSFIYLLFEKSFGCLSHNLLHVLSTIKWFRIVNIWNHNIKLAYYPFAMITCFNSTYFSNPFFSLIYTILLLINNDFSYSLPLIVWKLICLPNIVSTVLKNWSFKQQLNKSSPLMVLALSFVIQLTYGYCMTFQMQPWWYVTFL